MAAPVPTPANSSTGTLCWPHCDDNGYIITWMLHQIFMFFFNRGTPNPHPLPHPLPSNWMNELANKWVPC